MTLREKRLLSAGRSPILWNGGDGYFEDVRNSDCLKALAARGLVRTFNDNPHFFQTTAEGLRYMQQSEVVLER